jgi:hypothetical protein
MQTGTDDNGDLIFNDRPDYALCQLRLLASTCLPTGITRNTLLTDPTWTVNMFAGYSFTLGPSVQLPPGIQFGPGAGGTLTVTTVTRPEQGRYRMAINVFVNNLTNRTNLMGYSGNLKSEFFGLPRMAQGARRIQAAMNLQF